RDNAGRRRSGPPHRQLTLGRRDRRRMTDVEVLFAAVTVADLDGAVAWYARLFGRPADIVPNDNEVMWRLADAAWLYVLRDEKRAGHALVTVCVADLDLALAGLAARGSTGRPGRGHP